MILFLFSFLILSSIQLILGQQFILEGSATVLGGRVEVTVEVSNSDFVEIQVEGPADAWFGVGFGQNVMTDTYGIIFNSNYGDASEWILAKTVPPGEQLTNILTLVRTFTTNNRKTYVYRRPIVDPRTVAGATQSGFSFPTVSSSVLMIAAVGPSTTLAQHAVDDRTAGTLTLATPAANDIVEGYGSLTLNGMTISWEIAVDDADVVTIEVEGPSDRWFGIGFTNNNPPQMDNTYAIIFNGTGAAFEYILSQSAPPGTALNSIITVQSMNTVDGSDTTSYVITRPRVATNTGFNFPNSVTSVGMIAAFGNGAVTELSNHSPNNRGTTFLQLQSAIVQDTPRSIILTGDGSTLNGEVLYTVDLDENNLEVVISIEGPSDRWFGVGFGAAQMTGAHALICNSGNGQVLEYILDRASPPGVLLTNSSITLESVSEDNGRLTYTVSRPIDVDNGYDFPTTPLTLIDIVAARGATTTLAQHGGVTTERNITSIILRDPDLDVAFSGSGSAANLQWTIDINVIDQEATLTVVGPSDRWFALGFGQGTMSGCYAIIFNSADASGDVPVERRLGPNNNLATAPGDVLDSIITLDSATVNGNFKTYVIRRPLTATNTGYDFLGAAIAISMIAARGDGATTTFGNHGVANRWGNLVVYIQNNERNIVLEGSGTVLLNGAAVSWTVEIDSNSNEAIITCESSAAGWFAIGFGGSIMSNTYAIVFNSNTGDVTERILGNHLPGTELLNTVFVESQETLNNMQSYSITRPTTATNGGYSFPTSGTTVNIPMIIARASSMTFQQHSPDARTAQTLTLTAPGVTTTTTTTETPLVDRDITLTSSGSLFDGAVTYTISYDDANEQVILRAEGPLDQWFGLGFGGQEMEGTYAMIFNTDEDEDILEYTLSKTNAPGIQLSQTVTITNIIRANGRIIYNLYRDLVEPSSSYTFNVNTNPIPMISALGSDVGLAFHGTANVAIFEATLAAPTPADNFNAQFELRGSMLNGNIVWSIGIDPDTDTAFITVTGPSDRWFALGLGSQDMSGSYAFIFNSNVDDIEERTFADYDPGVVLVPSTVSSITVTDDAGRRTYTFFRPLIVSSTNGGYDIPRGLTTNVDYIGAQSDDAAAALNTLDYHGSINREGDLRAMVGLPGTPSPTIDTRTAAPQGSANSLSLIMSFVITIFMAFVLSF